MQIWTTLEFSTNIVVASTRTTSLIEQLIPKSNSNSFHLKKEKILLKKWKNQQKSQIDIMDTVNVKAQKLKFTLQKELEKLRLTTNPLLTTSEMSTIVEKLWNL